MNKTAIMKIVFLVLFSIVLTTTVALAFVFLPDDTTPSYSVKTINLPKNVKEPMYAHYTASGNIIFQYKNTDDNQYYVGVINDDGTNLHNIYNDEIKPFYNNTNGIRLMPFKDNKRILLGDGILECEPSIDEVTDISKQTKIVPIEYPQELIDMKGIFILWSEIIISPDNVHMGWTTLSTLGSTAFISRLERQESTTNQQNFISPLIDLSKNKNVANGVKYVMKNVQIISDTYYSMEDPENPGYILTPKYIHGGEIKQFTWDCQKVSFVGSALQGLARSTLQNLEDSIVNPIGHEPGYDETTIISPNNKYGLVMSSRFSPHTNCAILGLLPRPYSALSLMPITQSVYSYSITGVRFTRRGNIGPALINLEDSLNDNDYDRKYHGYDLHDPSDDSKYAFRSPMSWHYTSRRAIWTENVRNEVNNTRIRKVTLSEREFPSESEVKCVKETPDDIPYASDISVLANMSLSLASGKIASSLGIEKGGYIDYQNTGLGSTLTYINFTDDGIYYYEGSEGHSINMASSTTSYHGDVKMYKKEGEQKTIIGEMNFKLTFSGSSENLKLVRKDSSGKATYNGETVTVDDMED
ncbi:hypothetical protein M9Y10_042854 [Tritrichomonas musculus]|uniref:Uncharacterized protein n=1 Tax=Tritrichomonas musculus TaxID=1915356 RepID=A0ABR2JY16_9EUKA